MAKWEKVGRIKGDKGEQGERGLQGLKGDKGDKGDTPVINVGMFHKNAISGLSTINDINENGFYWANASVTGIPNTTPTSSWGIIHFNINIENRMQLAIPFNTADIKLYTRRTLNANQWADWREL